MWRIYYSVPHSVGDEQRSRCRHVGGTHSRLRRNSAWDRRGRGSEQNETIHTHKNVVDEMGRMCGPLDNHNERTASLVPAVLVHHLPKSDAKGSFCPTAPGKPSGIL